MPYHSCCCHRHSISVRIRAAQLAWQCNQPVIPGTRMARQTRSATNGMKCKAVARQGDCPAPALLLPVFPCLSDARPLPPPMPHESPALPPPCSPATCIAHSHMHGFHQDPHSAVPFHRHMHAAATSAWPSICPSLHACCFRSDAPAGALPWSLLGTTSVCGPRASRSSKYCAPKA